MIIYNRTEYAELTNLQYRKEKRRLQIELLKLQEWTIDSGESVAILLEGRDAAGKGGAISRIISPLNPRLCRVVALGTPTEREKGQWYFQRYVQHLPSAGEIVIFDRSWYNRAGVERVMGFCTEDQYNKFLAACPVFENLLLEDGITLIKYWFSVSDEEQERRFQDRATNPLKNWKLSPMDLESRNRWVEYSRSKDLMFKHTDTKKSPWWVVDGEDKKKIEKCLKACKSFNPVILDKTKQSVVIQITALRREIDLMSKNLKKFGLVSISRTGAVAMTRGAEIFK